LETREQQTGSLRYQELFDIEIAERTCDAGTMPGSSSFPSPAAAGGEGLPPAEPELRVVRPKVVPLPDFGVAVFESRHAPGFVGELQDSFSKFLLILAGQARWEARGQQIMVSNGSLIHIPENLRHRQQDIPSEPVVLYAIHYRSNLLPDFIQDYFVERGMLHWELLTREPTLGRAIRSGFQEMLFEQGDRRDGWEWLLCSHLVMMAVRCLRISQEQSRRLVFINGVDSAERVARYALQLQTRFYLQQTLDEAAMATSLSRRQFTETFRRVTGESWKQYIQKLRLEHARRLLLQTEKTVTSVAFESGFEDLSYFNHAFKKAFSSSPQAIRKALNRPASME